MSRVSKNTRQGNKLGRGSVACNHSAALSGDFGMKMLRAKFPDLADEMLARLGVYSRGPRKGLPRGYIHWRKVTEGGYDYSIGHRGVEYPGCKEWQVLDGADLERSNDIGAMIIRERMEAEQDAKEAAWAATPAWRKTLERAFRKRHQAHKERRDWYGVFGQKADADLIEDYKNQLRRARRIVREARAERAGQPYFHPAGAP